MEKGRKGRPANQNHSFGLNVTQEVSMIPGRPEIHGASDSEGHSGENSLNDFIEELEEEIQHAESKSISKSGISNAKTRSKYLEDEKNRTSSSQSTRKHLRQFSRFQETNTKISEFAARDVTSDPEGQAEDEDGASRPGLPHNFHTENLNVLVVGESKTGKTDLIQKFLTFKTGKHVSGRDLGHGFVEYMVDLLSDTGRRILTLIHMTGYSNKQPIKSWYTTLKGFVDARLEEHNKKLTKFAANREAIIDERIHFCLFLFKAPKPRFNDIICMKKLNRLTLVVPVEVGKREEAQAPPEQIRRSKKTVLQELYECGVELFDFEQKDPFLRSLSSSFLGDCSLLLLVADPPPTLDELELDDFLVLSSLLSRIPQPLFLGDIDRRLADRNVRVQQKLEHKKNEAASDLKKGIGFGMAVGVGLLGAVVALKNKLV